MSTPTYTKNVYNPYAKKWVPLKTPNKPSSKLTETTNFKTPTCTTFKNAQCSFGKENNPIPRAPVSSICVPTKPTPYANPTTSLFPTKPTPTLTSLFPTKPTPYANANPKTSLFPTKPILYANANPKTSLFPTKPIPYDTPKTSLFSTPSNPFIATNDSPMHRKTWSEVINKKMKYEKDQNKQYMQEHFPHEPEYTKPKNYEVTSIGGSKCYITYASPEFEAAAKPPFITQKPSIDPTASPNTKNPSIIKLKPEEKRIEHKGNTYNYKDTIADGSIFVYNCKNNRGANRTCTARIKQYLNKNKFLEEIGEHGPKCVASSIDDADVAVNTKDEIEQMVDKLSTEHPAWPPLTIYREIKKVMDEKYTAWYGITDKQIMQRVRNTRRENIVDTPRLIEQPQIGKMKGSDQWFMNANMTIVERKTHLLKKLTVYGNPELFGLLNGEKHIHIDATFRCAPKEYKQMLVIMVFDDDTDSYVDVLYILMNGKSFFMSPKMSLILRHLLGQTEWDYWDAIHLAFRITHCKMNPKYIYCDFEKALINAVRNQFRDAIIIGCLFHWKQAIRRHMISKLEINSEQVEMVMEKNCLDILTVIPKHEIKEKGIPYIKHAISQMELTKEDKEKWEKFWDYFLTFWMCSHKFIATWNINKQGEESGEGYDKEAFVECHNRTNNGIER